MIVWTSVLWKMKIHMAKQWPEMVVEQSFRSNFHFETLFTCFVQNSGAQIPAWEGQKLLSRTFYRPCTKDRAVVNKLILYNNILDLKLLYWLISHFSVSGKESGIVRHWWVVRDIAVDPQWNLWQPVDLDRFGFCVSNFLSILSDFLSWEKATQKNPSNFTKLQFFNNNIDPKSAKCFFFLFN